MRSAHEPVATPPLGARRRFHCALASIVLATLLLASGCVSSWRRPVSETAVQSRQLSLQGVDALTRDRWDDAENLFCKAIEKCPSNEQARRHYAEVLWKRGEKGQGLAQMVEAVRLSGDNPQLMIQLGHMYLDLGDLPHAEEQARRIIEVQPQSAAGWALLGDVQRRQNRSSEALAHYHRALSYEPNQETVQLAVAELYRHLGRPRRALATLDTLLANYPPSHVPQAALIQRGLALKELGRYDEGVETLVAATRKGGGTADLYSLLAETQLAAGDPSSARLALTQALRLAPDHPTSLQLLAKLDQEAAQATALR